MVVDSRLATDAAVLDDIAEALRRAAVKDERVIVIQHGVPVAAVIPLQDLRLLELLEEEELQRIELEEIRKRADDPENQVPIPLQQVKSELGL